MSEDIIEKAKQKLNEYERQKQQTAQIISLKDIIRKSKELKTVIIDGVEVKYGSLTFEDLIEINKAQTNEEKAIMMAYLMLRKADPALTLEDVKNLPFDFATKLLNALSKEYVFLTQT